MKITVNGDVKEVKDGITISELIEQEKVETPEYVSVSVNERLNKKQTSTQENSKMEMLLSSCISWEEASDAIHK